MLLEHRLTAVSYLFGSLRLLWDSAEQYIQSDTLDQSKLAKNLAGYLRDKLDGLALYEPVEQTAKNWLKQEEYDQRSNRTDFDKRQDNKHTFPLRKLYELANTLYGFASDGQLCYAPGLSADDRYHIFSVIPKGILQAVRVAMELNKQWDNGSFPFEHVTTNQEFERFLLKDFADPHVHCRGSVLFSELFLAAIRGLAPPPSCEILLSSGTYRQTGETSGEFQIRDEIYQLKPLLLSCKVIWRLLLQHLQSGSAKEFRQYVTPDFESNDRPETQFWYEVIKCSLDKNISDIRLNSIIKSFWKIPSADEDFFQSENSFEYLWFLVTRHVIRNPEDISLSFHYTQLLRCLCAVYGQMNHREGFYEFENSFSFCRNLMTSVGEPSSRLPRRYPSDVVGLNLVFNSLHRSRSLRQIQLRISPSSPRREKKVWGQEKRKSYKPPISESILLDTLRCYLRGYCNYLEQKFPDNGDPSVERLPDDQFEEYPIPIPQPILAVFPIHFTRNSDGNDVTLMSQQQKDKWRWCFQSTWEYGVALAQIFIKHPHFRYFFGFLDVAGNEDKMPTWPFALLFQEIQDRLICCDKFRPNANIPPIHYDCHAGEHFHSSIQGLRRIWEAVHFFPQLHGIGHAMVMGVPDRFPREMPQGELLDDLVWLLMHQQYAPNVKHEILRHECLKIVSDQRYTIDHLEQAYRFRFDREQIAIHTQILMKTDNGYEYNERAISSPTPPDQRNIAASILWEYLTNKEFNEKIYTIPQDVSTELAKAYQPMHLMLENQMKEKGVIVECCPTSNLRIGHLISFAHHPVFALQPPDNTDGLAIKICTDDPTIFQTVIEDEYVEIWEVLEKNFSHLSVENRIQWLDKIRQRGLDFCCGHLASRGNSNRNNKEVIKFLNCCLGNNK